MSVLLSEVVIERSPVQIILLPPFIESELKSPPPYSLSGVPGA